MVLLSAGIWPGLFRNRQTEIIRNRMGVAVFLDVSGSVNDYLPGILGILSKFKDRIRTVYLFSNKVVESSMAEVCNGQIKTTYGTDFDCIAQEIIAKSYDRAVVITDGVAEMEEANTKALQDAGINILTILFDNTDRCPAFEPFGEVVVLEEVTEDG